MSFRWWSSCVSDAGRRRRNNEDAFLAMEDVGVWVVADGMGGHLRGDLASKTIVDTFSGLGKHDSLDEKVEQVQHRLDVANQRILEISRREGGTMGSTVVALIVHEGTWVCMWAGDSRAYRLSRGSFRQVTHDHSMFQEHLDRGDDSATINPRFANRITRAVGATARLSLEARQGTLKDGDIFLLCTDGLNKEVADHEMFDLIDTYDCDDAASRLLQLSLDRGARDNVTVAVIRFESLTGTREINDESAVPRGFKAFRARFGLDAPGMVGGLRG